MKKTIPLISLFIASVITLNCVHATPIIPDGVLIIETEFERQDADSIKQSCLGFVIETDGYVLTSYQQISDPETSRLSGSIQVTMQDGDQHIVLPARVIGLEPTLNFAVLKIDHDQPIKALELNTDRDLTAEEPVYAYHQDSTGEFHPINGTFTVMNQLECYQENLTGTMLKTEIDLPADSIGGPIIDSEGKVFAMHTAHDPDLGEDEEEAQAAHEGPPEIHLLSMELAMNVYDSIKQRGSLISPWTGFSVRTLTDEEIAAFPLASNRVRCGIGIEHVWEGGPAEALGIHKDDILFKMSHYPICTVANFQRWLYLYGVGTPVKLYFVRRAPEGDKLITVSYTIEERPKWAKPR